MKPVPKRTPKHSEMGSELDLIAKKNHNTAQNAPI
jgi:hypothetical protein